MNDKDSIVTKTIEIDTTPTEPPSIVTSAKPPTPPKHSGEWVMPPAPLTDAPYAVLPDGTVQPLMNCEGCGEMGFAAYAHLHRCPPIIPKDEHEPLSVREVRERIGANLRHYFRKHPEEVEGIRATREYERHVEQLSARARKLPEGHWGHR